MRSEVNIAKQAKINGHIKLLSHPANSPNLSPQEPVWRVMKASLRGGRWNTLEEFKDAIRESHRKVKQSSIRRYIIEMPQRCEKLIQLNGGRIRSKQWL
jgi:hypothetical protein